MSRATSAASVSLLIIGFAVLAMMVAVVVDASAAYLRAQGLDSARRRRRAGRRRRDPGRAGLHGGLGERAEIDPAVARRYVAAYLREVGAARHYPGLSVSVEAGVDRVVVHVAAPLDLPITPPGWARRPVVSGTAASVVLVSD